jgi:hypothetical protein
VGTPAVSPNTPTSSLAVTSGIGISRWLPKYPVNAATVVSVAAGSLTSSGALMSLVQIAIEIGEAGSQLVEPGPDGIGHVIRPPPGSAPARHWCNRGAGKASGQKVRQMLLCHHNDS